MNANENKVMPFNPGQIQ